MVNNWKHRKRLGESATPMQRIRSGLAVMLLILFSAVLGYVLNGWSWLDSVYMVVITVSGVGYGEVHPVDTPLLRWLTIGLITCGYLAAIYTVGGFAQLLIDGELRRILGVRKMQKEIDRLEQHVIICGFGRMGSQLTEALATRGKPLIVIDQDAARVEAARGYGCLALQGKNSASGRSRAGVDTSHRAEQRRDESFHHDHRP